MATLPISILLFSIVLLLPNTTRSAPPVCEKRYCRSPESGLSFEFPFLLKEANDNQSERCGYPGFEVFCNDQNQALITLPNSGEFVVKGISLDSQRVWINDPGGCLPRRFLYNMSLLDSPFQWDNLEDPVNLTFLNCTKEERKFNKFPKNQYIPCLSDDSKEYFIVYTSHSPPVSTCRKIGYAAVPVKGNSQPDLGWEDLYSDIVLQWVEPSCQYCEADQHCGFSAENGLQVACYNNYNYPRQGGIPSTSNSRTRRDDYKDLALGIFGLLFLILIASVSTRRLNNTHRQQEEPETGTESNNQSPPLVAVRLDGSAIEKYPKIQIGESGKLPMSIENVCSICLCEYQPMETLRSMPQCNHHFHAHCIDSWLKMNAACPLCRKLPNGFALVTSLPPS